MAKRVHVVLIDDIDKKSTAAETVSFALDGVSYEIDLTEEHATDLRNALALYIGHAERVGGRKSTGRAASSGKRTDLAAIRDWARAQGRAVNDRGRLPADLVADYDRAHA